MEDFCFDCGGRRRLPNGELCDCAEKSVFEGFNAKVCSFIPEDYGRLVFSSGLLPDSVSPKVASRMSTLAREIATLQLNSNVFLRSDPKSGKTVLAYSSMVQLFKNGVRCFPLKDILELRRIMIELDSGKSYLYKDLDGYDIDELYTVKYLFVQITETSRDVTKAMLQLVGRRSRNGKQTIFLSSLPWNYVVEPDITGALRGLKGDGILGTIEVVE